MIMSRQGTWPLFALNMRYGCGLASNQLVTYAAVHSSSSCSDFKLPTAPCNDTDAQEDKHSIGYMLPARIQKQSSCTQIGLKIALIVCVCVCVCVRVCVCVCVYVCVWICLQLFFFFPFFFFCWVVCAVVSPPRINLLCTYCTNRLTHRKQTHTDNKCNAFCTGERKRKKARFMRNLYLIHVIYPTAVIGIDLGLLLLLLCLFLVRLFAGAVNRKGSLPSVRHHPVRYLPQRMSAWQSR